MLRREYDLPVWALAACLRWENLGAGHPVLNEEARFRGDTGEREIAAAAQEILADDGVLKHGRLDPEFRDTLAVLARPGMEFSCWAAGADGKYQLLVAGIGRDVVLVVRSAEHLWLYPGNPQAPAESLVSWLPQVPPADSPAINVSLDEYRSLGKQDGDSYLDRSGAGSQEAKRLHALVKQERLHAAELGAATRDRSGTRRRAKPATVIDTEQGRWLMRRKGDWVVAAPGSPQLLTSTLYELQDDAR